jgi:hypothetical protein
MNFGIVCGRECQLINSGTWASYSKQRMSRISYTYTYYFLLLKSVFKKTFMLFYIKIIN